MVFTKIDNLYEYIKANSNRCSSIPRSIAQMHYSQLELILQKIISKNENVSVMFQ